MKSDKDIIENLQQSTAGLWMMSESDYPFEVINLDGETNLSVDYLRERAAKTSNDPVSTAALEDFFRASTSEAEWKNAEQIATARRFQNIVRSFKEELTETKVFKIGRIDITVFILGKSPQGNWLGLSTRVIET